MKRLAWLALLMTACAPIGCVNGDEVDLATFNAHTIELRTDWPEPRTTFELVLSRDHTSDCARLAAGVSATVNDVPLTLKSQGIPQPTRDSIVCDPAIFEGDLSALSGEDTRIVVSDDSHTISFVVKNAGARRRLDVADSLSVAPGSSLTLLWSPQTDVLDEPYTSASLERDSVQLNPGLPASQEGSSITFQIPSDLAPGNYVFSYDQTAHSGVVECEGIETCFQSVSVLLRKPIEVKAEAL